MDTKEGRITQALDLFPNVQPQWIRQQFDENGAEFGVEELADIVLGDQIAVPMKEKRKRDAPDEDLVDEERPHSSKAVKVDRNQGKRSAEPLADVKLIMDRTDRYSRFAFDENAVSQLADDFKAVSIVSLRSLLQRAWNSYAVAWALLQMAGRAQTPPMEMTQGESLPGGSYHADVTWHNRVVLVDFKVVTKARRATKAAAMDRSPLLMEQMELVLQAKQALADQQEESTTAEEGPMMECPICCCEYRLSSLFACASTEAHLFCRGCVSALANEVVCGQTPTSNGRLSCMQPDCSSHFSTDTLDVALDVGLRRRLSEAYREQDVHAANLDNYERCRFCNWGACVEVPKEVDKVFRCQNESCLRQFCRLCGKDWEEEHFGKRCDELLKSVQDRARREFEEKMSATVIRECPNCRTPFDKVDGCNRMTCRCRHTMCYLCRQPKITYKHFCTHLKEPGKTECVEKCGKCMLWEVAKERDANALSQLQQQAQNDQRLAGTSLAKTPIGGSPI